MLDVCKCCGQTLPAPIELKIALGPARRRLLLAVHAAGQYGIPAERLYRKLYDDPVKGEPSCGMKALHARVCSLNKNLAFENLRIIGEHTGSGDYGNYRLVKVNK